MANGNTTPTAARNTCKHPGCGQPAASASGPGRPPEYCEGRGHTKVTAWRERRRLAAARTTASRADIDNPVTMARVTGAELLRLLRVEADRVSGIADRLREAVETVTDPTAAEAEVEAVRAAAEQRATAAEARAAAAEQRVAEADQWRAEADAAAEEMGAQLAAAQARAAEEEAARAAAETDRDAAIDASHADAAAQVAAAEMERDAAIRKARAEAGSVSAPPKPTGTRLLRELSRPGKLPSWPNRTPPAHRTPPTPPRPRPAGSAPTRT